MHRRDYGNSTYWKNQWNLGWEFLGIYCCLGPSNLDILNKAKKEIKHHPNILLKHHQTLDHRKMDFWGRVLWCYLFDCYSPLHTTCSNLRQPRKKDFLKDLQVLQTSLFLIFKPTIFYIIINLSFLILYVRIVVIMMVLVFFDIIWSITVWLEVL